MNPLRLLFIVALCAANFSTQAADKAPPKLTPVKREKALRENDRTAHEAMDRDSRIFPLKKFHELEADYQAASDHFRKEDAKTGLETFLKKWTKGNRVGCATLYLAQKSKGEDREKLLRECIGKYSDCYYLNGAQVGGLARLFLWDDLKSAGKTDEAEKLLAELKTKFALCNDHNGHLIVEIVTGDAK
jgi:hypothetical protein